MGSGSNRRQRMTGIMKLAENDDYENGCCPNFSKMVDGAEKALKSVLSFDQGQNLLVVTDTEKQDIGHAFISGAKRLGGLNIDLYSISQHRRPLEKLPKELKGIYKDYHVVVNAFSGDAKETPFRVELLYDEIAYDIRVAHAPGITKEMMYKGPMNVDYKEIVEDAMNLMDKFKMAKEVHITTKLGTDLILDILDRGFSTDVIIDKKSFGNLPAGEIWCAPTETKGHGKVVVDGSIGDIGMLDAPLTLTLKDGHLVGMESEDDKVVQRLWNLVTIDPMASIIGELGIGLNPNARLVGNLLEDEKAGETAHIAFGNNMDMQNGTNNSKTHRDFLFNKPSMVVTYTDGTSKEVIRDGKVV